MLQKFITLQQSQQKRINLLLNYLFIVYAFTLPMAFDTEKIIFKLIIILYLFSGNLKEKLLFSLKNRIFQAMLLFISLYTIWIFGSEHKDLAIEKIKIFTHYIFLFPIYITSIREDFKEKILNGFLFAIFTSEIISYTMLFNMKFSFIHYTGFGANVPFFYTYSQYVLLLSLSLGLVLYKILSQQLTKISYVLYSVFFIVSTINIFILDSKLGYGLYLLSILTVLLYLARLNISKTKIIILSITIIISYIVAFNFSHTFSGRIHKILSDINIAYKEHIFKGSTGKRLAWNMYGFKVYLQHPLFGVGTFDHIDLVVKELEPIQPKPVKYETDLLIFNNKTMPVMTTLHNEYLDHLIQFGPFGLFVLFYLFYTIYKAPATSPSFKLLKYLLLINIILYSFVNYFFVLTQLAKIFFFLIALTIPTFKAKES